MGKGVTNIGSVSDKASALHDADGLAVELHSQLGELREHLGHLIAALAAAHIDNGIAIGELGLQRNPKIS